jgi:endonuclease/exonuclease/phosphatase family metal-dependent hydrolase
MRRPRTLLRRAAAVAAALALTAAVAPATSAAAAPPPGKGTPLTVMTRNVYLGGDITRPLRPAPAGVPALVALANQNHELRRVVGLTDFPARAELLAKEVADTKPDVIGLQEVATWRSGPIQLPPPTDAEGRVVANAATVDYDFLDLLLGALERAGQRYEVVHEQVESDVEGPAFRGLNPFAPGAEAADHRLTMSDVLLKRASSQIKVERAGGAQYAAVLPFELGGFKYEFIRGYNWADVRVGAKEVRLLNTHLESQLSSFAMLQAQELVRTQVLTADRPVVLTCDCNSDPLDTSTKPGEPIAGIQHRDPYLFLTRYLDDAWLEADTSDPGFTSGLNETVDEPAPASFTHRIDLVLTRGLDGAPVPADKAVVVGTDPANRTAGGLWPSDHAGVVVRLRP